MIKLYHYYRSSASYRVRIALNIKKIAYESIKINLVDNEQNTETYAQKNPQELVPTLEDNGMVISQSMAILEYLEEKYPLPALLPQDPFLRAKVRAFCQAIACEIHPLNNLRVLRYLTESLKISDTDKTTWYHHWLLEGFHALEKIVSEHSSGKFCFGDHVTFADLCLIPQIYNALRFTCPMDEFPILTNIYHSCLTLPEFIQASPE